MSFFFIMGDWTAIVENQEVPGITGKFGLGVQNEAAQRLKDFFFKRTHWLEQISFQQPKR